jgi:signal transduction histidine kinase
MRDPERGLTREAALGGVLQRLGDRLAVVTSTVGLERSARLAAVALVPVFLSPDAMDRAIPVYTALIAYVLITSPAPRNRYLRAADIAVSAALIVALEGQVTPFLVFLMVTVAGPATMGGIPAGLAAGGTLTIVLGSTLAATGQIGALAVDELLPVALLLPLTGVTAAVATQVRADEHVHDRQTLQRANRLLSALREIADDIPGGLDVTTVAAALVAEARELPGSSAAIVYAESEQLLRPAASSAVHQGELPTLRFDQLRPLARPGRVSLRATSMLPEELQGACRAHRWWKLAGMYRGDDLVGVLVVAFDEPEAARAARRRLVELTTDGALALQNAQLFDVTQARAADAARRHLAGDLHDGVAQALAHLRMELELLALSSAERDGGEAGRLARVAREALEDLRGTIAGLRAPGAEDLAEHLRRHIEPLRTPHGPELILEHVGDARLDATRCDDVLRIAQEAVSNALRHAEARTVQVDLECGSDLLHLVVEDDGRGLAGVSAHRGGGVGFRSMRERAERLEAQLTVRERHGGGTVVDLRCPLPPRQGEAVTPSPPAVSPPGTPSSWS